MEGKTKEEFRESLAPRAAARAARALVLGEVVRVEHLTVHEEEIDASIDETSSNWGSRSEIVRESLQSDVGRRTMANRLLGDKAIRRLVAIAKGELEEAPSGDVEEDAEQAKAVESDAEPVVPDVADADETPKAEVISDYSAEPLEPSEPQAEDEAGPEIAGEQDG
jgi:hypothetical protein